MKRTTVLAWIFVLTIAHNNAFTAENNLLINGGFELGFGGWLGTYGYVTDRSIAVEGRNVGVITDVRSSSVGQPMYQPISTQPWAQYSFSFNLLSGFGRAGEQSPGNAPVAVYWGDQRLGVFSNPVPPNGSSINFRPLRYQIQRPLRFGLMLIRTGSCSMMSES